MVTPRTSQRRNGRRGRERGASIVMEQVCVSVCETKGRWSITGTEERE